MKTLAASLTLVLTFVGTGNVRAQSVRTVRFAGSDCAGEWSEERFVDALRVELHPFAELGEPATLRIELLGGCERSVRLVLSGDAGVERTIELEDIPLRARERAVAMAAAHLIESLPDTSREEEPTPEAAAVPRLPDSSDPDGGEGLAPPPTGGEGGALPIGLPENETPLALASEEAPPTGASEEAPPTGASEEALPTDSEDAPTTDTELRDEPRSSGALRYPRRHVEAAAALGWFPIGGAAFGADLSVGIPLLGPLFLAAGASYLRGKVTQPIGSVALNRLEAHLGVGIARYYGLLGIEARFIARAGWASMVGASESEPIVSSDATFSFGIQLDAGLALRFRRVGVALRAGPIYIVKGLRADHPGYSFIAFRFFGLAAALGLRVPF